MKSGYGQYFVKTIFKLDDTKCDHNYITNIFTAAFFAVLTMRMFLRRPLHCNRRLIETYCICNYSTIDVGLQAFS